MTTTSIASPRWSALIYSAGANDLSYSLQRSLDQLHQAELPENLDVFVQSYGIEGEAVRYRLSRDEEGKTVETDRQTIAPNAGEAQALESFLGYAEQTAPANSTFLVMGGHGEGHKGAMLDDSHQDRLELAEMEAALAQHPVDTLLYDSCLMGSLEVAHTLSGEVGVMVASEDVVRSGTPLVEYLKAAAASADGAELGQKLVQARASGFTSLSAVSTSALENVVEPMSRLSSGLLALDVERVRELHEASRRGFMAQGNVMMGFYTYPGDRLDVGDFCLQVMAAKDLAPELRQAASDVALTLKSATLAHSTSKPEDAATGLTLSLPLYRAEKDAQPEEVSFWKATGWDKVVETFQVHNRKKAEAPDLMTLLRGNRA